MSAPTLSQRLENIAAVVPPEDGRGSLLAALRVGAEIALARIAEVGGGYPTAASVAKVHDELFQGTAAAGRPIVEAPQSAVAMTPVITSVDDDLKF